MDELWSFLIEPLIREAVPGEICLSSPAGPLSERVRSLALRRSLGSYARLAVVDGNPNWYSVHQALTRLAAEPRFPLVFVDAVGWPYGHRDRAKSDPVESRVGAMVGQTLDNIARENWKKVYPALAAKQP